MTSLYTALNSIFQYTVAIHDHKTAVWGPVSLVIQPRTMELIRRCVIYARPLMAKPRMKPGEKLEDKCVVFPSLQTGAILSDFRGPTELFKTTMLQNDQGLSKEIIQTFTQNCSRHTYAEMLHQYLLSALTNIAGYIPFSFKNVPIFTAAVALSLIHI